MTVFEKQVTDITYQDLAQLVSDKAKENVRLEFKREILSKDEALKKISSMANTYGGIIVIGLIALLSDLLMRYVEKKLVPWKGKV